MDQAPTPRLFTVGSILADVRLEVPYLPARGGDVIGSRARVSAGGGFNILCAAARQGLPAFFAGRHGTGPYGDCIRAELKAEGIGIVHPPVAGADSGFCLVMVEPDGERTFVSSPGVEAALGDRRLADLALLPGDTVFVSGYDLFYADLAHPIADWLAALPPGIRIVVDPGPMVAEIAEPVLRKVVPRASVWTMNRREAALLVEKASPAEVRRRMRPALSPEALLIVRDGAGGAHLSRREGEAPLLIASPRVDLIDSTGAGDTHSGVLIAALAAGFSPAEAVRRANAAAAISVTRAGPATAPRRAELDLFLLADAQRHLHNETDAD